MGLELASTEVVWRREMREEDGGGGRVGEWGRRVGVEGGRGGGGWRWRGAEGWGGGKRHAMAAKAEFRVQ